MNTYDTNRLTMFKTVLAELDASNSVWSGMAPMQAAVERAKARVSAVDTAAQRQELPSGATDEKEAARNALEDVLFLACEALGTLAHTTNDHALAALTDVRPTVLDRMGEAELSNRAASIVAVANARKADLVALHVTEENIEELNQALADFNASKEGPRRAKADRMTQTETIPALIRELNTIFREELDRMVNLFRRSNPEFVGRYRAARVIVDRAATRQTKKPQPAPAVS